MTNKPSPAHVEWSRQHFDMMKEGGTWGVPRSGLLFNKSGKTLLLTARMPHDPAMPISPEQLAEQQQADFDIIKQNFGAAGIAVIDMSRPAP